MALPARSRRIRDEQGRQGTVGALSGDVAGCGLAGGEVLEDEGPDVLVIVPGRVSVEAAAGASRAAPAVPMSRGGASHVRVAQGVDQSEATANLLSVEHYRRDFQVREEQVEVVRLRGRRRKALHWVSFVGGVSAAGASRRAGCHRKAIPSHEGVGPGGRSGVPAAGSPVWTPSGSTRQHVAGAGEPFSPGVQPRTRSLPR